MIGLAEHMFAASALIAVGVVLIAAPTTTFARGLAPPSSWRGRHRIVYAIGWMALGVALAVIAALGK